MADISITAANVIAGSNNKTGEGTAYVAITAGDVLIKTSNGLELAQASDVAKLDVVGIALNDAAAGQPVEYNREDADFTLGGTIANGAVLYLSETAGGVTATLADITTDSYPVVIGMGIGANKVSLNCIKKHQSATAIA